MNASEKTRGHHEWDEQRLVTGIAAGQSEARVALVSASHDAVFTFACRLSPDQDLRRDWTHDCLLRIISDIETGAFQLRHPGGFWSWFRKRSWFLLLEARRTHRRLRDRETLVDELPEGLQLQVGKQLEITGQDGNKLLVMVTGLADDTVTLDGNHPLAGKDLTFDIKLLAQHNQFSSLLITNQVRQNITGPPFWGEAKIDEGQ